MFLICRNSFTKAATPANNKPNSDSSVTVWIKALLCLNTAGLLAWMRLTYFHLNPHNQVSTQAVIISAFQNTQLCFITLLCMLAEPQQQSS